MRIYIPISKDAIERRMNMYLDTALEITQVIPYMEQLRNIINLTDEEIKVLENARKILGDKSELLEDLLEDENVDFF